jgi:hypothetical protein
MGLLESIPILPARPAALLRPISGSAAYGTAMNTTVAKAIASATLPS